MTQEILPPRATLDGPPHYELKTPGVGLFPLNSRGRIIALPPGSPVPSGHWWVFVEGHEASEGNISVNGHALVFPRGHWFVCEDHRCKALRNSDLPMRWLDGADLWEKVVGQFGAIQERKVGADTGGAVAIR